MTGGLTLGAALMLGFAASGHCLAMCGGISAALGLATAKTRDGQPRASLLVAYQVGRMLSYAIAGALLGGVLGLIVSWLDFDAVRLALRALSALRSPPRRWSRSACCAIRARASDVWYGRTSHRSAGGCCP